MELPKAIKERIDQFSLTNLLDWSKSIFTFYARPRSFFVGLFQKDTDSQINQLLFYLCVLALIFFVFYDDTALRQVYQMVLTTLSLSAIFSIFITAIDWVIAKKNNFNKIICYQTYVIVLFFIPIFICLHLFVVNENYIFLFGANCINVLLDIYIFLIVWNVLFTSIYKIILGYIATIIALNIVALILAISFEKIDDYSTITSRDPIIQEFNFRAEKLAEIGVPFSRVNLYERNKKAIVSFGYIRNDTVSVNKAMDSTFIKSTLMNNILYLDTTEPKLHFSRNKKMFKDLSIYFKSLYSYLDTYPCDTCLISVQITRKVGDSMVISKVEQYEIDSSYIKPYVQFVKDKNSLADKSEFSEIPLIVYGSLFLPANYLYERFFSGK